MKISALKSHYRRHGHKTAYSFLVAGIALLIFPEPVFSNILGSMLIVSGFVMASVSDYLKIKKRS